MSVQSMNGTVNGTAAGNGSWTTVQDPFPLAARRAEFARLCREHDRLDAAIWWRRQRYGASSAFIVAAVLLEAELLVRVLIGP